MSASPKYMTHVQIKSRNSPFIINATCLAVDDIVDRLPSEFFSIDNWTFPQHLTLADPSSNVLVPQSIDILLGASIFRKVLKPQTMKMKNITSKIFCFTI